MRSSPALTLYRCLLATVLALSGRAALAQTIGVNAGATPNVTVAPGTKLAVPVVVDLSQAGALNLASLQSGVSWSSGRLTFDSVTANAALGWAFSSNATGAPGGSASFSTSNGTALTSSSALATFYFTASATQGGTRVTLAPTAAANSSGGTVVTSLVTGALDVCVAIPGNWGDVNADGSVNIIDAQQIARFSVGLSVANAAAVGWNGDVTSSSTIDIIDAQQIARFSVGLSATARTNTPVYVPSSVSTVTVTSPGGTQYVTPGAAVQLTATPRDASNADLSGCAAVSWNTSDAAVATVSPAGVVMGVGLGTATITATAGGQTAPTVVTITNTQVNAWTNPAGGLWSGAANWSLGRAPLAADSVAISLPGTYTVTLDVAFAGSLISVGASGGTQTLSITSRTLTMNGPLAIGPNGAVTAASSTITGPGSVTNQGTISLGGSTISAALSNQGLVVLRGLSALQGVVTTAVGSTMRMIGDPTWGGANATVASGFTNTGAIELTDVTSSYGASLTVTSGTLTNAAGATITTLQGTNGSRALAAQIDNLGTITVTGSQGFLIGRAGAASLNRATMALTGGSLTVSQTGTTPTFTNTGTITVASGRFLSVSGGTFTTTAGTVSGAGTLSTNGTAIDFTTSSVTTFLTLTNSTVVGGTVTIPAGQTLSLVGGTLSAAVINNGLLFVQNFMTLSGAVTTGTGSTIRIQGNSVYGGAGLTVTNGFTNTATIELTDITSSYGASLTVTNGTLVNAPGATLVALQGTNGARTIAAELDNQSTITVSGSQGVTIGRAGAASTNSGTIALTTGNLTIAQSGTTPSFTNTGAITIASGRTLNASGGTFNLATGTVSGAGTLVVTSATVDFTTSSVTVFLVLNNATVAGGTVTIPVGQFLNLTGGTLSAAVVNNGLLFIQNPVTLSGAVTTGTGSTIRIQGNSIYGAGALTVSNGFTNTATIELTDVTSSYGASLTVTNGTLTNAPGATISLLQGANGARTIAAELNNQSTITISGSQGLTLTRASAAHVNSGTIAVTGGNLTVTQTGAGASFTNTGSITVASGRTWTVSGGLLTLTGGTLTGAGTLATSGSTIDFTTSSVTTFLTFSTTTVAGGTVTIPSGQSLNLTGGTLSAALVNNGLLFIQNPVTLSGAVTTGANSTIRVQGNSVYGAGALAVTNGFTNTATIELSDITSSYGASLTVTNGTLTNAPGATISVLQGANGARVIAAEINNQSTITLTGSQGLTLGRAGAVSTNSGTISLATGNLTISQTGSSPSFTNTGAITIAGGRTLSATGGAFNLAGGTVSGAGTLAVSNATIDFTPSSVTTLVNMSNTSVVGGTVTIPAGQQLNLAGGTLSAALVNNGTLFVQDVVTLSGAVTTGSSSTILVQGNSVYGLAALTVTNGFTNTGTIQLTDIASSYGATLTVPNGTLTNGPGATLVALQGANGVRAIAAELNNQSTITIAGSQGLTIGRAGAASVNSGTIALTTGNLTLSQTGTSPNFTNTGAITIASGRTLSANGGVFNLASGTVSGAGTLAVINATIDFTTASVTTLMNFSNTSVAGGTVTVPSGQQLNLAGGTLSAALVNNGVVFVQDVVTMSGAVTTGATSTIRVQGNSVYGLAALTITNGFTNNGTIELGDITSSYGASLTVPNGTLTNAPGATLVALQGANGIRTITAELNNQSTITIAGTQGLTIGRAGAASINSGTIALTTGNLTISQTGTSPSFTNTNAITIASGRTLTVNGGALNLAGGSTSGAGTLAVNNATVDFTTAAVTSLLSLTNTSVVGGTITIPSGQSLNLVGGTLSASVVNNGLLFIQNPVTVSGALTTGTTATIRVQGNSVYGAGQLTVANGFTNNGTIELTDITSTYGATMTVTAGTLTNAPGATIVSMQGANGVRTLTTEFDNQGTITVGGTQTFSLGRASAVSVNSGTIAVSGGNLTIVQSGTSPSMTNTGLITIASGRTATVTGGAFVNSGGTIQGTGTLNTNGTAFTNNGVLSPAGASTAGILTVIGGYSAGAAGALNIELGGTTAGTLYDKLIVSGAATLGGTLNVSLIGGFLPPLGSTFTIMTYSGSPAGNFTVNLPAGCSANPGAGQYTITC